MSRFDYVRYDETAAANQAEFKAAFEALSNAVTDRLQSIRAKEYAQTKLEEAYMWIGKAIRDDQVYRNGAASLQEERINS